MAIDYEKASKDFDEIPALSGGRRCGVQWAPWMGDWFTSWSPRNSNNHAEGPWEHWVALAERILAHPMTAALKAGKELDDATIASFLDRSDGDKHE